MSNKFWYALKKIKIQEKGINIKKTAGKPPAACKRCPSTTDGGGDVGFYEVLRGVLYKHLDVIRDTICDNAVVVDVAKQKKANKQKKMDENEEEEIAAAAAAMERKEKFCTLIGKLSDTINTVLVYKDRADKQQQNALYIEEMNKSMRTFLAEQKADIAQQLGSTRIQDIQGKVDEWMKEQEQKVEEYNAAAVNNGANPGTDDIMGMFWLGDHKRFGNTHCADVSTRQVTPSEFNVYFRHGLVLMEE